MSEYECPKCKRVYSGDEFIKSKFCADCGMHLSPKYVRELRPSSLEKKAAEIKPLELTRDQINVHTLFDEFMRLNNFSCGEGIICKDVPTWISNRKRAYTEFQKRLSEGTSDPQALHDSFKDFLYFKHNRSWTTLYRSGTKALGHPESLRRLLIFLQDESVPIQERIDQSLRGRYSVEGIGIGILTGLLHTLYPDKYGVWNSRTVDTLNMIKRKPTITSDLGRSFISINEALKQLSRELNTDLATIDGFMWFISKRVKIIA